MRDQSLAIYFSEVDGGKLLTKEQEIMLAKTIEAARYRDASGRRSDSKLWRDDIDDLTLRKAVKAREKLVNSNLRLVASVAKRYQGKGCELEDLIQEGNIGLMDGIDRFDWTRNLKISTYCTWWIRQRIDRLISNHGRTVRVPVHVQTLANKAKSIIENYVSEFNMQPSIEEMANLLDSTEDMAKAALQAMGPNPTIALDHSPSGQSDNDETLHSYIEDEEASSPLDSMSHKELVESIKGVIKTLPERDEKILRLRFGIIEDDVDHKNWPISEKEMQVLEQRKRDAQE
jgi:RNA polymerase primary sigma factor